MAATGLADVGTRDPHPLVLSGRGKHPLQQLAVAGLELGALLQLAPRRANPHCQRVANRLQIAQAECPRLRRYRGDSGVDLKAREGVGEERAELRFQPPDLAA